MTKKPTITTVTSGFQSNVAINANFESLRDGFDNTLSLDGSTPNAMGADLDMNSNDLINGGQGSFKSLLIDGTLFTGDGGGGDISGKLNKAGDTMTGNLVMEAPSLASVRFDRGAGSTWGIGIYTGSHNLVFSNDVEEVARISRNSIDVNVVGADKVLLTRDFGDDRYLQKFGGTTTGDLHIAAPAALVADSVFFHNTVGEAVDRITPIRANRIFVGRSKTHYGTSRAQTTGGENYATGASWIEHGDDGDNIPAGLPAGSRTQYFQTQATLVASGDIDNGAGGSWGSIGVSGCARAPASASAIGVAALARADVLNAGDTWAMYAEAVKGADRTNDLSGVWGMEIAVMNFNSHYPVDGSGDGLSPYLSGLAGHTKGLMISAGGNNTRTTNVHPVDIALHIRGATVGQTKGQKFRAGIVFDEFSLVPWEEPVGGFGNLGRAIQFAENQSMSWWGSAGAMMTEISALTTGALAINRANTATPTSLAFYVQGSVTLTGSISHTTSSTSFNTTSDKRLKTNIQDAHGSGEIIDGMQVRQYNMGPDANKVDFGFIAQEAVEFVPNAVTVGSLNNFVPETVEDTWAMDFAKIVPVAVLELQSLRKRVAELELAIN
ncbi:MAG: tail fiber domain-containing protein [Oleispira sp.]|nr:tail fiber domain-containing protein [Oleispira sp.]